MNKYEAGALNWKDEDIPDFMPEEGNYNVRSLIFKIRKTHRLMFLLLFRRYQREEGLPSVIKCSR